MKHILFKITAGLLLCSMLAGAVACGDETVPQETQPGGTVAATNTETESEAETFPADFQVTEADGKAQIYTPTGLRYTLSGYESMVKGTATFKEALTVTFPEGAFAEAFNRFTITYKATQPLKVTINYKVTKYDTTDYYFLEAGEGVFSGLPGSFMNDADCFSISGMTVEALTGEAAEFVLADLTTERIEVPKSSLYIENERFKLGVDLDWGGTINYIEDKLCDIPKLTNLVNKHDTGRLIQQSFYGTAGVPGVYEPGISFDVKWVYNPVQGGDQYNNSSRLIDLQISENSVYIKSQPQDWSLDNELTPSYMENTYTLMDDFIEVDNRFVDYSGWEHRYASQELPAVYTVSYLDTFVWYDGDQPWTGDALSSRGDLNFWGDAQYVEDCTFTMKEDNTETWCAWINPTDNYGLGIYVPNVDQFKAGRYEYSGTKNAKDVPSNYVAPLNIIKLVSFKPLEYSYLLTAGSLENIRATFTEHKDFSDNASLRQDYISTRIPSVNGDVTKLVFDAPTKVNALTSFVSTTVTFDENEQAAKLVAGPEGDASFTVNYGAYVDITTETHTTLSIEYMIPTDNGSSSYDCDIFLCAGDVTVPNGDARLRRSLIVDGEYHVLEIDLSQNNFWKGDIHQIRIDYFDHSSEGDVMYIKGITLE